MHEFREALSLQCAAHHSGAVQGEARLPRVELYRLVPIADPANCRLAAEDLVVAHLPDSTFSCAKLEDVHRQREEAEMRCERARESMAALVESLELPYAELGGRRRTESGSELQQENRVLRHKLNQSEVMRQELQETTEMLRKEFMMLVHEVLPRGASEASPAWSPRPTPAATPEAPLGLSQKSWPKLPVGTPSTPRKLQGATDAARFTRLEPGEGAARPAPAAAPQARRGPRVPTLALGAVAEASRNRRPSH